MEDHGFTRRRRSRSPRLRHGRRGRRPRSAAAVPRPASCARGRPGPTGAATDAADFAKIEREGAAILASAVVRVSALLSGLVPVTSVVVLSPSVPAVV
jgi:hypothetical protein